MMSDTFLHMYRNLIQQVLVHPVIHRGEWQGLNTSTSRAHATHEWMHASFQYTMPEDLAAAIVPDLPWADEHFAERVSGVPHNPPPSATRWPWAVRGNGDHTDPTGAFDHTYPERFWPRHAGLDASMFRPEHQDRILELGQHRGIRFRYGDLSDVVTLLVGSPFTRRAFLPVWFPEDTGLQSPHRVPCTIGYHFLVSPDHKLDVVYFIRSCDLLRHFRNDVYFACRLGQWVAEQVNDRWDAINHSQAPGPVPHSIEPGRLVMHISSLHAFVADVPELERMARGGPIEPKKS